MDPKINIQEVLRLHQLWLKGDPAGKRANLRSANLYGADLEGADLEGADLEGANLRSANLEGANLYGANLYGANLRSANLEGANLYGANLYGANLYGANLEGADLSDANLYGANLEGADLSDTKLPDFQICPTEGSFIAWKALRGVIAKLEIIGERNCTLKGRKCRTNEAKVLAFYKPGEETPCEDITSGYSKHNGNFLYTMGGIVTPDSYDNSIQVECTNGIHFFMTRKEAEAWL